ncbi:MAG TPA: 5-formyltetrahydrofolate cyclo-ligase [Halanaerobiales bacterium]|nr:5-formyltetrahydrofolate cyclo-ligase [Halanaerobiales bacterium]
MEENNNKEILRKKWMKKRKKVAKKEGDIKSKIISKKILSLKEIKESKNIMIYVSYRSEVSTNKLIISLLNNNKRIFAPYCIKDEKRMEVVEIENPDQDLEKGAYGIKEPAKRIRNNKIDPKNLDIVVVPAVAFSKSGYRVGYGGGYYDRFLERLANKTITIGINYEEMLFDTVPKEDHDLAVDMVVTDKRLLRINK